MKSIRLLIILLIPVAFFACKSSKQTPTLGIIGIDTINTIASSTKVIDENFKNASSKETSKKIEIKEVEKEISNKNLQGAELKAETKKLKKATKKLKRKVALAALKSTVTGKISDKLYKPDIKGSNFLGTQSNLILSIVLFGAGIVIVALFGGILGTLGALTAFAGFVLFILWLLAYLGVI